MRALRCCVGGVLALALVVVEGRSGSVWAAEPAAPAEAEASDRVLLPAITGDEVPAGLLDMLCVELGRPVERSELALAALLKQAGCSEETAACLRRLGLPGGPRHLLAVETRRLGSDLFLRLRLLDLGRGSEEGSVEVPLGPEAGPRRSRVHEALSRLLPRRESPAPAPGPEPDPDADEPGQTPDRSVSAPSAEEGSTIPGALTITASAPDVEILLDGQSRGLAPLSLAGLPPGPYALEARRPDRAPWQRQITLRSGQELRLHVDLGTPPAPRPEGPGLVQRLRWPTWTLAGTGVASFLMGAAFGGHMLSVQDDLAGRTPATLEDIRAMEDLRDQGQQSALAANILFGLGTAALVGAVVLGFRDIVTTRP